MNLRVTLNAFMLYVSTALIAYGLRSYLNPIFGAGRSILDDAWAMIAIATAAAVLTGYAYPQLRGVKKGDVLIAQVHRQVLDPAGNKMLFNEFVSVQALEDGRLGKKIRVSLANGAMGEGVIESYAGTIQPPLIKLTESERL
ncbi:MAG: hypothetical protein V1811_01290 [Candidatus Micrarchaeota archaeon]